MAILDTPNDCSWHAHPAFNVGMTKIFRALTRTLHGNGTPLLQALDPPLVMFSPLDNTG